MTTLNKIKSGQKCLVKGFKRGFEHESMLISLGLVPGDKVTLKNKALFGCPLWIQHGTSQYAIRKGQASFIEVEAI